MNSRKPFLVIPLLLIVIGLRIPFRSQMLYDFDSIGFASGIRDFDVSHFRPHPPGYPLYIVCGKVLNHWLNDPNRSMVSLSIIANVLSVLIVFLLGSRMFSTGNGLLSSLFLTVSPLFWLFGEVSVPYAFGILFSAIVALFLWESRRNKSPGLYLASIFLGVGGGFRPDVLISLSPLWVFSMRGFRRRQVIVSLLLFTCTIIAWFVPTVLLSGGWRPYWEAIQFQKLGNLNMAFYINAAKILAYSAWGLGFLIFAAPLLFSRSLFKRIYEGGRLSFSLIWITPYLLATTLIEFGQPGMLLVILPCILFIFSEAMLAFLRSVSEPAYGSTRFTRVIFAIILCIGITGNGMLFIKAPFLGPQGFLNDHSTLLEKVNTEFFLFSAKGIRFLDRFYKSSFEYIKTHFPPSETIVLTNFAGWVHALYYLPSYPVFNYFFFYGVSNGKVRYIPEGIFKIPRGVRYVVLFNGNKHSIVFEDTLDSFNLALEHTKRVQTSSGSSLSYLELSGSQEIHFTQKGFALQ